MRRSAALLVVALCLLGLACTLEQRAMFSHLRNTQKAIAAQYPEGDVNVNLMNDRYVTVSLINSRLNGADEATRAREARKVATTAASLIGQPVDGVSVVLVRHRGAFGFHHTATVGSYGYSLADLVPPKSGAAAPAR